MTVKASDIKFGIEIECALPEDTNIEIRGHFDGPQVRWLPNGWQGRSDSSLSAPRGYKTAEIVSPILSGEDGLTQVWYTLQMIKELHGIVNSSCGLHVHVDARTLSEEQVKQIKAAFRTYEKAFYGLNGEQAEYRFSGNGSTWCQQSDGWVGNSESDRHCRYRSLNLTNFYNEQRKKTLEIRVWAGCLEEERVVTAVYMAVALVASVLNGSCTGKGYRINEPVQAAKTFMSETFNTVENRIVEDCTVREVSQVLLTACRQAAI